MQINKKNPEILCFERNKIRIKLKQKKNMPNSIWKTRLLNEIYGIQFYCKSTNLYNFMHIA